MGKTKIEWTDVTWNPVTGCTKVSDGCQHCYAERMAKRLAGRCGYPADYPFRVTRHPDRLGEPLRWRKPRMVFVCSMGDLFHKDVPFEFIDRVFAVMGSCSTHTFQILTKRSQRMREWFERIASRHGDLRYNPATWPLPNVWLGASVEDQATADERIPHLLKCPAAVRFVSAEPLLGDIDLGPEALGGYPESDEWARTGPKSPRIDWCIVGGESGPMARPMHPDWARSLRDQCAAAGVPFFFKQWGEWVPEFHSAWTGHAPQSDVFVQYRDQNGTPCEREGADDYTGGYMARVGKRAAGRLLDGVTHDAMPGEKAGGEVTNA